MLSDASNFETIYLILETNLKLTSFIQSNSSQHLPFIARFLQHTGHYLKQRLYLEIDNLKKLLVKDPK